MKKMNKRTIDKINRINEERKDVLTKIKTGIQEGNAQIIDNLDTILNAFEEQDKECKEYVAILKVKEMLNSLFESILNAETIEDVQAIRNKINYQINKVKSILVKRDIPKETIDAYSAKVKTTRNWITEYVRCMKRENNIESIQDLLSQEYNEENKDKIIKLANSEDKFNKRIKTKNVNEEVITVEQEVVVPTEELDPFAETDDIEGYANYKFNMASKEIKEEQGEQEEQILKFDASSLGLAGLNEVKDDTTTLILDTASLDDEALESSVLYEIIPKTHVPQREAYSAEEWKRKYGIMEPKAYDGNIFQNIATLFTNLPIYRRNKRIMTAMTIDYDTYYHGDSLGKAIESVENESSIKNALGLIFGNSKLFKREAELQGKLSDVQLDMVEKAQLQKQLFKKINN